MTKHTILQKDYTLGTGKSPLQKSIETLERYLDKLKEYTHKLHVCGERNSYSKTDPDVTFMRMKEDAMGNGQPKAGYNVQHGVDPEYITWVSTGPQPTDTTTLIPLLEPQHPGGRVFWEPEARCRVPPFPMPWE